MKITGRNIKQRLYGLKTLPSNLKRARYFRGHGVHSPFVYSIVRQVFMVSELKCEQHSLYDALLALRIPCRRAIQLQNLMSHCGYESFKIDCQPQQTEECDFVVATISTPAKQLISLAEAAAEQSITLCIMNPTADRERDKTCRQIVEQHRRTSVDNRGYLLLFNNHLPKQTFRL